MTRSPNRIIFTGDFLRPSPAVFGPTQHENIKWLAQLLGVPVSMATELPCEEVFWHDNWVNQAAFEKETITSIYACFWLKPSIHSWAQIFNSEILPSSVELLFKGVFENSFVIGFEIPPYLMHFLNRHEIGFLDCALSPVRFMDDLIFSISASHPQALMAISTYNIPKTLQKLSAGVVSSHVAKRNPAPPRPNTLLLVMQTRFDKAVIHGSRFVSAPDYLEDLKKISQGYSQVLIKQHPLETDTSITDMLLRSLPNASLTDENFYRLVSHPNLTGVAALSSSCLHEAELFGKQQHALLPGIAFDKSPIGYPVVDVGDALLRPDFWRDALGATGLSVTPNDGLALPSKPNRFRLQHRTAWGYNQIDTDISVAWATD